MNSSTPQPDGKAALKGCGVLVGCFFIFIMFFAILLSGDPEAEKMVDMTPEEREVYDATNDEGEARVCAQFEMESMLKSPSTADFPYGVQAIPMGDNIYLYSSYVDSQNSFGATIRTSFTCEVEEVNPDSYQCSTTCIVSE